MAITKKADTNIDAIAALVGLGIIGVPTAAAWIGHSQAGAESRLEKDKDFAAKKQKLQMYNEAINAIA